MIPRPTRIALALALSLAAGCATTPPLRYYLLVPQGEPAQTAEPALEKLTIGIGPITIPDYLDRPDIVIRRGANRLVLGDMDKWGEPFDPLFGRVLTENIGRQLGSRNVVPLPQRRDQRLDAQLELDLLRFDAEEAGTLVVDLRWRLSDRDGTRLIANDRLTFEEPVRWPAATDDTAARYEAIVATMNQAAERLAQELATILRARLVKR